MVLNFLDLWKLPCFAKVIKFSLEFCFIVSVIFRQNWKSSALEYFLKKAWPNVTSNFVYFTAPAANEGGDIETDLGNTHSGEKDEKVFEKYTVCFLMLANRFSLKMNLTTTASLEWISHHPVHSVWKGTAFCPSKIYLPQKMVCSAPAVRTKLRVVHNLFP